VREITEPIPLPVRRGPVAHERREQIVEAAHEHFRAHGYEKTSVADLAKAIGVSSAYVYRFFDSKQSIGEAVCSRTLATIAHRLFALEAKPITPTEKLKKFYGLLLESGYELLIHQRKMHELVASAVSQNWAPVENHRMAIRAVLRRIVTEGRERGEFERKTPLGEVVLALGQAAVPFAHPLMLEQRELKDLRASVAAVAGMVLRSLAT
jgi:AcrR family transcriptional regulator